MVRKYTDTISHRACRTGIDKINANFALISFLKVFVIVAFCFFYLFSQRIQMKEVVAGEFISRFQLTPEETQALKGTKNGPITEVSVIYSLKMLFIWKDRMTMLC